MAKTKAWHTNLPLGKYMDILTKGYKDIFDQKLSHLEINRYYSILLFIENTEHCTQQHISDYFKTDKASMVRIMNYLSKHGMINKHVNEADRRELLVCLTDKAKKILPEIHDAVDELNEAALDGLSKKDIKHLYKYLETINDNLNSLPAIEPGTKTKNKEGER